VQDGVTVWWYDIKLINTAILVEEKRLPLYDELTSKINVEYIAGGATQNSNWVVQWMLQISGATSYRKCIRKDRCGAVCIVGGERSLIQNLLAPHCYQSDHLKRPVNWAIVEKLVVEHAKANGELF